MKKNVFDDETLKKMEEITKRQSMLLAGLYDDIFGEGKKKPETGGIAPKKDEPAENDGKDALKNAEEALDEAKKLFADADQEKKQEELAKSKEEKEPETDPMEDLNALIGLETIKHDVKELTDFVKVQKMRSDKGMKSVPVSLHLVFTGNPGTGKTTVARILARLYKQIGVLSKGQLIEVDRSGLVAGYVGQTALKTQDKIKQALGGILFIDEAYALAQRDDTFGQEAIDTVLKAMEDNRDDLVVIVAGYTGPMEKFIGSNPGLKSRFNKYIEFPDYTLDELEAIFYMNCDKYEYHVDEEIKTNIRTMIAARKLAKHENFANAREVRNMFEEIITNQARRVAAMDSPEIEEMTLITSEDLMDVGIGEKKTEDPVPAADAREEPQTGPGDEKNEAGKDGSAKNWRNQE